MAKEKIYNDNLFKAEQNAIDKIKAANSDVDRAATHAHSLSKQLSEAKRRVSSASKETIVKYVDTSANVLNYCLAEYREMEKFADGHRINAERLSEAWPAE